MSDAKRPERVFRPTPMQEGMLFETVRDGGSGASSSYVSILRYALEQADPTRVGRRWREAMARHGTLRSLFRRDRDGRWWQAIFPDGPTGFAHTDLAGLDRDGYEKTVAARMDAWRRAGLNPEKDVLFRLELFTRAGGGGDLLVVFHHAVADGWSVDILLRELFEDVAPAAAPSFADYADWLAKRDTAADLAWWRDYLRDATDCPTFLPGQRRSAVAGGDARADHRVRLPHSARLREAAARLGTTPGRLLTGVWALLVARCNEGRALIGQILSGRTGEFDGVFNLMGMCVHTIPLAAAVDDRLPFSRWFAAWSTAAAFAERHAFAPVAEVRKLLPAGVDPFTHLCVVDPPSGSDRRRLVATRGRLAADFIAGFTLESDIVCDFSHNPEVHPADTVADMAQRFVEATRRFAEEPEQVIASVPLLIRGEESELLCEFNRPRVTLSGEAEGCFLPAFREAAARRPDAVALAHGGTGLTYRELVSLADRMAMKLIDFGVGRNRPVALLLERSERLVVAALAVMAAGGAYLPLDPAWPEPRKTASINAVSPVLVLDEEMYAALARSAAASPLPAAPPTPAPSDLAYLIMTSGTTGEPKAVAIEHAALENFCRWSLAQYGWRSGDVSAIQTSFAYDASMWGLWPALAAGAAVHIIPEASRRDLARIRDFAETNAVTHMDLPTAMAEAFMEQFAGTDIPSRLRHLATGGEAMRRSPRRPYAVTNEYGPTECAITCLAADLEGGEDPVPIGRPLPNMRAYVIDGDGRLCPVGVEGELCFSGAQLARGYFGRPEATAEKIAPNPFFHPTVDSDAHRRLYRTGDRARWLRRGGKRGDGFLEYLGRRDGQVKIRGHRVEIGEVEAALARHPGVLGAAVAAVEAGSEAKMLCAYVTPRGETPAVDDLKTFLSGVVPAHMVPAVVTVLPALPLTPGGKVDYARLPRSETPAASFRPPATAEEQTLATALCALLKLDRVGMEDNYQELGGDSIVALRLAAGVGKAGYVLPVDRIMAGPDLAAIAKAMRPAAHAAGMGGAGRRGGRLPDARTLKEIRERWGDAAEAWEATPTQDMILFRGETDGFDAYATATRWRLASLDPDAFRARVELAARRHDSLTAALYRDADGRAWMVSPKGRMPPCTFLDLSALDADRREAAVAESLERHARGIDPRRDPPFAADVFRFGPDRCDVVLRHHHAMVDGWSLETLRRELFAVEPTSGVAPSFREYVDWLDAANRAGPDAEWWERYVAGAEFAATPYPRVGGEGRSTAAGQVALFDPGLADRCRGFCRRERVTPAAFFATLWGLALAKHGGHDGDIVYGAAFSGRPPTETMGRLVGMCAQILPFRLPLGDGMSFRDLARRAGEVLPGLSAHPLVPPGVVRRLARHLFAFDNAPRAGEDLPEPAASLGDDDYDLAVVFSGDGTSRIRYRGGAAAREWAALLAAHLRALAEAAMADPGAPAASLSMVSPEERHRLLKRFARGGRLSMEPKPVVQIFRRAARGNPRAPALLFGGECMRYSELDARTDAMAAALRRAGAAKGETVGVALPRSADAAAMALAVMKTGAAYLPLDPSWPRRRLEALAADARIAVLAAEAGLEATTGAARLDPAASWRGGSDSATGEEPRREPALEDAAYAIYTSGTTGTPKAAVLDHLALATQMAWARQTYRFGPGDGILHFVSLTFDPSIWTLFAAWTAGACVHLLSEAERLDTGALARHIAERRPTVAVLPARVGECLLDHDEADLSSIRLFFLGGEAPAKARRRHFPIVNMYGPTEACIVAATRVMRGDDAETRIIGRPVGDMHAYVLGRDGEPAPIGVAGELCLSGPQLARGYLNRLEETARAFVANPFFRHARDRRCHARLYRTGDVARWTPLGELEYLRRDDGQVKIRGQRVEVGELEAVAAASSLASQAAVAVRDDPASGKRLDLYFVPSPDGPANGDARAALRRFLAERLPPPLHPASITRVEALPLTANGKLDASRLPPPDSDFAPYVPPATQAERDVARAWSETLGVERIGRDDDFFALGGHSLLIFPMLCRLPASHRADARLVFTHSTLSAFAAASTAVREKPASPPPGGTRRGAADEGAYAAAVAAAQTMDLGRTERAEATLLTGAAGFLGAHLVREYLEHTGTVLIAPVRGDGAERRLHRVLARYFGEDFVSSAVASGRLRVPALDLSRPDAARALAEAGPYDLVVHSAASIKHYGDYAASHADNVAATENLLRAAGGAAFAHISTLGAVNASVVNELVRASPAHDNVYLRTKQLAEEAVFAAAERGLAAAVFRVGNIAVNSETLSPPAAAERNALLRLTAMAAVTALVSETIRPVGYAYVDQVARAVRLIMERPALRRGVYHLANPETVGMNELYRLAGLPEAAVLGEEALRNALAAKVDHGPEAVRLAAREYLGRLRQHELERSEGEIFQARMEMESTLALLARLGFAWKRMTPRLAGAVMAAAGASLR